MIRAKVSRGRQSGDSGDNPFWISFSDLMTALMVLFLVALTVVLLAVTHDISEAERKKDTQENEVGQLLRQLAERLEDFPGVSLRGRVIDFGDRARFPTNSDRLAENQAEMLRRFVPLVLDLARDPLGEKWLKRVVVEGFADARGGYLHNLDLSLRRSERVLCVLLLPGPGAQGLVSADRQLISELFLVSGASFNALKNSPEESRRIEFRLEFREPEQPAPTRASPLLDVDTRCPLDAR